MGMTTTTIKIALEIDLERPVDELEAKVMGRAYTIDGVTDVRLAQGPAVQVSPLEFVTMALEKEHLVSKPLIWAEWPNKESNDAA